MFNMIPVSCRKHPAIARLAWAMLLIAPDAAAAWLGTCDHVPQQAGVRVLQTAVQPTGSITALVVADQPLRNCTMTELPVTQTHVRDATVLSRAAATALAGGLILKAPEGEDRLARHEVIPLRDSARMPTTLPPATELIPYLQASAFGTENRAAASVSDSRIAVECAAGNKPAGALLKSRGEVLPAGAALNVQMAATATHRFRFGAVDDAHARLREPLVLGTIAQGSSRPRLPLPKRLDTKSWRTWVVECPQSAAQLDITSLRLEPQGPARAMPRRALWIWQPEAWQTQPEPMLALLSSHGADTAFITISVTADLAQVAAPAALAQFVRRANSQGIGIWAVAGDPRAVLPAERDNYVTRARAYAAYNRSVPAEARLAGFQLDIEPYLNPGYATETEGWLTAYLDTLARVRAQTTMPLDVAIPFWWGRQRYRGGLLLDHLTPLIDVVTVMNYRTERRQLLDFAEPFLAWGARAQRRVRIGLESGPIADESMRIFRSSEDGELWLLPLGKNNLLVMLDSARPNPAGHAFAYTHTAPWHGSSITFRGQVDAMRGLLPGLEKVWHAWPSFAGIALHGLDAD